MSHSEISEVNYTAEPGLVKDSVFSQHVFNIDLLKRIII